MGVQPLLCLSFAKINLCSSAEVLEREDRPYSDSSILAEESLALMPKEVYHIPPLPIPLLVREDLVMQGPIRHPQVETLRLTVWHLLDWSAWTLLDCRKSSY